MHLTIKTHVLRLGAMNEFPGVWHLIDIFQNDVHMAVIINHYSRMRSLNYSQVNYSTCLGGWCRLLVVGR